MNLKPLVAAAFALTFLGAASAATFSSASLRTTGLGTVELDGFGRGASNTLLPGLSGLLPKPVLPVAFFDTWDIDSSAVPAGTYSFTNWVVPAFGSVTFSSMVLSYFDDQNPAVRQSVLFTISADGKSATGSGQFMVLSSCPVNSCLYIDVVGTQLPGDAQAGYGGSPLSAALVPEPATWGLFALGLAAVGGLARRRAA